MKKSDLNPTATLDYGPFVKLSAEGRVFNLFISLPDTYFDMYYFALFGTKRDKLLPKLY